MLDGPGGRRRESTAVISRRIAVTDPYRSAKSMLLGAVSRANRCRTVWDQRESIGTVFGVASDLDIVELLFTSLLVQATESMLRAGSVVDRRGTSRTRSFRHSFLIAFAGRIGQRLRDTTNAVVADEDRARGGALLPVLVERQKDVEEAMKREFPHLVTRRVSVSSDSGYAAGRAAADRASLSTGSAEVGAKMRPLHGIPRQLRG
jgi:hypothetical protein